MVPSAYKYVSLEVLDTLNEMSAAPSQSSWRSRRSTLYHMEKVAPSVQLWRFMKHVGDRVRTANSPFRGSMVKPRPNWKKQKSVTLLRRGNYVKIMWNIFVLPNYINKRLKFSQDWHTDIDRFRTHIQDYVFPISSAAFLSSMFTVNDRGFHLLKFQKNFFLFFHLTHDEIRIIDW